MAGSIRELACVADGRYYHMLEQNDVEIRGWGACYFGIG